MEFIKGMDISFLGQMLDKGAVFRDREGNKKDVYTLLKENGVNSIRLRIWNNPENVSESGGYCDLEKTIAAAKDIKKHGMSFLLDFHYSDYWADPGKQFKPKAWENLGFEDLVQAVYDYTAMVLTRMKEADVLPDMVQIGNEIRCGMLFPDGAVPAYSRLARLVNAGLRAVKETSPGIKTVIHLDQGGKYDLLEEWFDAMFQNGLVDFDIIGLSYYPFWHGTYDDLTSSLSKLSAKYKKPIVIAETAHPWRRVKDGFIADELIDLTGYDASPEDQRKVIDRVMEITAALENDGGIGVYYWEPVVYPFKGESGWYANMGIFDENGVAMPALESFRFTK